MKVMITGASGLLGRAVFSDLKAGTDYEILPMSFTRKSGSLISLDLTDSDKVIEFLDENQPDYIIHAAAERHPDVSEQDPEGTKRLNIKTTETLARWASENQKWLLYISTDYVFDGTKPPYKVDDKPNPLNFYGESKLSGEEAVCKVSNKHGILRVPVLYGGETFVDESAISSLIKTVGKNEAVTIDHWAARYPTHVADVASVCRQIIQRQKSESLNGIWHWSGDECFTKYEMCRIIADITGSSKANLIPSEGSDSSAPRPKDCHLDKEVLLSLGINASHDFRDSIRKIINRLAEKN